MALTATAPPDTLAALQSLLKDPVCTIASVNKPNICYSVHQIQSTGKSEYAYLTTFQSDKYEVVIFWNFSAKCISLQVVSTSTQI